MSAARGSMRSLMRRRAALPIVAVLAVLTLLIAGTSAASAYWTSSGAATATASTGSLSAPDVDAPVSAGSSVSVSWSPGIGGIEPKRYDVTRHSGTTSSAVCSVSISTLTEDLACTDESVPDGSYTYVVTAVHLSWTARSEPSSSVSVITPLLGAAASFSVLARTAVVGSPTSSMSGDLGVSPGGSIAGIFPENVGGDIHLGDAQAAQASTALGLAYTDLSTVRATDVQIVGDLGGRTYSPGVYHITAALALTGDVTLNAAGDSKAIFVFQTDAAFDTAAASHVILAGGALASNVYWVVAGAAGTGANSFLSGNIVANGAITLGAGTTLIGRALSLDAVTMAAVTIRFTTELPPSITIAGGATAVTKDETPTLNGTSTAPASSPVKVTIAGQILNTSVGADGTWTVTAASLPAGVHSVLAKVRDSSGNGNSASQTLTVEVNPAPVVLGAAAKYSVLASTGIVSTGNTTLSGAIGVTAGTITGFPPGTYDGARHVGDADAANAQNDLSLAITEVTARAKHTEIVGDLGGRTFHVGVHHSTAALALTGTVTLDGEGNPDARFIFVTDAAFDTAAASRVVLTGGAQASNVFWVAVGAVGTGANSFLSGSVLSQGAITLGAATALTGQVLSRGTVTMAGAIVTGISPGAPLISQGKPATASSSEAVDFYHAFDSFDGNLGTRWSSAAADPQWIMVDLGEQYGVERVDLYWEGAYATAYEVQASDTGTGDWRTLSSTTAGPGGDESLTVAGEGRFIRMLGTTRATGYGYSLWEFRVFGAPVGGTQPAVTP